MLTESCTQGLHPPRGHRGASRTVQNRKTQVPVVLKTNLKMVFKHLKISHLRRELYLFGVSLRAGMRKMGKALQRTT